MFGLLAPAVVAGLQKRVFGRLRPQYRVALAVSPLQLARAAAARPVAAVAGLLLLGLRLGQALMLRAQALQRGLVRAQALQPPSTM